MTPAERRGKDETFLRSRAGKHSRRRYWQMPRVSVIDEDEDSDEDDHRDMVEVLERSLRDTDTELCGAVRRTPSCSTFAYELCRASSAG
ncbi:hypothetical protein V7S43_003000 [Phytophthora oleae]|uniref:Uncharacterized protein n=1 Tax=Phytophthora oleae TaxID=2107226 RepID=A0ABD3G390_9STRA